MMMGPFILAVVATLLLIEITTRIARQGTGDAPKRMLDLAVRGLPPNHRDWGTAMTAELDHLHGRRPRWTFALGCTRTALLPPRSPKPVLVTAAAAAALTAAATLTTGAMRPFTITLAAAAGIAATTTLARSRKPNPPGTPTLLAITAGAAATIAVTIHTLVRYPAGHDPVHSSISDGRNTWLLISGGILIAAYLWTATTPPRALAADRRAATTGTIAGLAFTAVNAAATVYMDEKAIFVYLGAPLILFTAAAARAGIAAAVWAGLTGALWTYGVALVAHFNGYQLDALRLDDVEPGPLPDPVLWYSSLIGQDLGNSIFGLAWLPLWGLLLGIVGDRVRQAGRAFREELAR
ncbi:MAG TPA: hypothetical protein VF062_28020 [Candidatus Limnocylindrales bacterium]